MRLIKTTFGKVPVMGFFWNAELGVWMIKVSTRRAVRGPGGYINEYTPASGRVVWVLA